MTKQEWARARNWKKAQLRGAEEALAGARRSPVLSEKERHLMYEIEGRMGHFMAGWDARYEEAKKEAIDKGMIQ